MLKNAVAMWPVLFFSIVAQAAPNTLTYQGRIVKSDGMPLEYNNVSFLFEIKSEDGLCVYYREQKNGVNMTNSKGVFDVPLGTGTKLFPTSGSVGLKEVFDNSTTLDCADVNNNVASSKGPIATQARRLSVQFHDGVGWNLITPDNEIRSVPYAHFASSALKLGNYSATDFVRTNALPAAACSAGQVVFFDGSDFTCVTDAGGTGVISDVLAGTGVTVTGTTSKTVNVTYGTTTGTAAQGNDSRITGAFQSATNLGGDLSGTLPNPTVAKIQGIAVATTTPQTGQVYRYGATELEPVYFGVDDLRTSTGLAQFATSCTASQTLTWSAVTDAFTCSNITGLDADVITAGTIDAARLPSSVTLPQIAAPAISAAEEGRIYFDSTEKKFKVSQGGSAYTDLVSAVTFPLRGASGSAGQPSYSFTTDTDTGMFNLGSNSIALSTGGTSRYQISDKMHRMGDMGSGTNNPSGFAFDSRYYGGGSSYHTGRFTVTGSNTFTANAGISGPAAGFSNSVSGTVAVSGDQGAMEGTSLMSVSGGFTGTAYGVRGTTTLSTPSSVPSTTVVGLQTGLWGLAKMGNTANLPTALKVNAITSDFLLDGTTGNGVTVDQGAGLEIRSSISSFDTLNQFTGVMIRAPTGTGTITSKYAILTEANAGSVGIGTLTPAYMLHVNGTAGGTSWANTSDRRFKRNIATIDSSLEKVLQLRGVTYDWRTEEFPQKNFEKGQQVGLIAQEVQAVFPDVVTKDNDGFLAVQYANLVAPLIEAMKEFHAKWNSENEALKAENAILKQQVQALQKWACQQDPTADFCR
ncbi:tail fiber domain-containing protein [Bdellovibrio bacteriovorus]|nr:tail fiber domain-containing protein [Bdellovibrio bacteriovorus]